MLFAGEHKIKKALMKRKNDTLIYICIILITVLLFAMLSVYASATSKSTKSNIFTKNISAKAATLYEPTSKKIIYSKNGEERLPMASTTKIMTAMVVVDNCNTMETVIIGPESVGVEGSSAYLSEGDEYTVLELLYALMLQSANDAATALAYFVAGGISEFSEMMNRKANDLGLENTHFTNPHGLDAEDHYTTSNDLAIMSAELLENEILREIVSTYKKTFTYDERTRTYINHNKLLRLYADAAGVKTGFTKRSGRCLVGAAERDGMTFISVTLDAPSDWSDHTALLDFAFDSYEKIQLTAKGDYLQNINVVGGDKESVYISAKENLEVIKEKETTDIEEIISLPKYLIAPIKEGETVGRVTYKVGGRDYTVDLVALNEVNRKDENNIFLRILKKISK